jgi:hypothetical protein
MKKILLPMLLLAMVGFTNSGSTLTKEERKFAKTELKKTSQNLHQAVKGLSIAQLNFKASPESWSIAEITEHITISENNIFGMLQGTLKNEPDPSKRLEVKLTDQQVLDMIVDRSNKVKTQKAFEPTGQFGSHAATLAAFSKKRESNIDFVKNTQEDLRNRYQQLPFGTIDAFQILMFMSAHTERHVLQIEEVKNDAHFPKS